VKYLTSSPEPEDERGQGRDSVNIVELSVAHTRALGVLRKLYNNRENVSRQTFVRAGGEPRQVASGDQFQPTGDRIIPTR
jgi:hypothetical protein